METYLDGKAKLAQAGVLDKMTKEEIEANLAPQAGEYVLTSRLELI